MLPFDPAPVTGFIMSASLSVTVKLTPLPTQMGSTE